MSSTKLADPHGMIARIRRSLNPNCAVRLSPYCDVLISMRMQNIPYLQMEKFLIEQGKEKNENYRISAPTLYRNFMKTKLNIELPYAEELAERWGGRIDLDLVRELSGQILIQRQRVDKLVRREQQMQRKTPGYHDKRIRAEQDALMALS